MYSHVQIAEFSIPTFGICIVFGVGLGYLLIRQDLRLIGIDTNTSLVVLLLTIIGGTSIGSLFHLALISSSQLSFSSFTNELIEVRGGYFYTVLSGVTLALILCSFALNIKTSTLLDLFAPGIIVAQITGRIGCFLTGCCYGSQTDSLFAIDHFDPILQSNIHTHPVILYEIVSLIIIFFVVLNLRKHQQSNVFITYITLYAIARFFLEYYRGDWRPYFFNGEFSVAQCFSLTIVSIATMIHIFRMSEKIFSLNKQLYGK